MEIYNLMIGGDGWSSSELFDGFEKAVEVVSGYEDAQKKLEGESLLFMLHYSKHDLVVPPFHVYGEMVYCSCAMSSFRNENSKMWRVIYKQTVK